MTAIAALILGDGQATPVNHTFGVVGVDASGAAKWVDRSGGISAGFPQVSLLIQGALPGGQNRKVSLKVAVPRLAVTSPSTSTGIQPAPQVAYTGYATLTFTIPERASALENADLFAYVKNILALAHVKDAVTVGETIW